MIILSGGANGADKLFGNLGIYTIVFSFKGHICNKPLHGEIVQIPQMFLNAREKEYNIVCRNLKRKPASNLYIKNLMLRTMFQITNKKYNSELVVAIGDINLKTMNVDGGTGYAIEKAKIENIPIVVLNKKDNIFYIWDVDSFKILVCEIKLTDYNCITGIGSRDITDAQCDIIKRIFENSLIKNI